MAYYTKINKTEFKKYLVNYSLGDLFYFKGIDEGIENTNYFFKTKSNKCVLTIYENKITDDQLISKSITNLFYKSKKEQKNYKNLWDPSQNGDFLVCLHPHK